MFHNQLVKNIADFYQLEYQHLIGLKRTYISENEDKEHSISFREKTVENILRGIENSKNVPFERVLFALGIRFVGEVSAKKLAQHFGSIDNLRQATIEQLIEVEDIGEKIAESIVNFFTSEENISIIERLRNAGLQMTYQNNNKLISRKLEGMVFVVSGTFSTPERRKEIELLVEQHGGKKVSSVNKKLSFIVAGANMGPEKLKKAETFGIPMAIEGLCYEDEENKRFTLSVDSKLNKEQILQFSKLLGANGAETYRLFKSNTPVVIEDVPMVLTYRMKNFFHSIGASVSIQPEIGEYHLFEECWKIR